ncbi:hypothetical protein B9G55_04980 [Saccharibacillus sp. O16]|nr:hypothetical protein B9G55_04980 [Saccharibacillus sp. O16]
MSQSKEDHLEHLAAIARHEIKVQSLALTRQLLANQTLEQKDSQPVIAGIIEEPDRQRAQVYIPIEDESYFFVVYLDTYPKASLRFVGMEAGSRVYSRIMSESLDLKDLLEFTPLKPNWVCEKGEKVSTRSEAIQAFSGMTIEPDERRYVGTELKLESLLDLLEQEKSGFPLPNQEIFAHVQIVYYGYKEQMSGIHLSTSMMQRLSALGLEIDIDLYASGPDLAD